MWELSGASSSNNYLLSYTNNWGEGKDGWVGVEKTCCSDCDLNTFLSAQQGKYFHLDGKISDLGLKF